MSLSLLDDWLIRNWSASPEEYRWLILQTMATAASRRQWILSWPAIADGILFDLGCGPGIVSQEIATLKSTAVVGYDQDPHALEIGQNIDRLCRGPFPVKFRLGNILDDFNQDPGDGACVRFVAQYAENLGWFMESVKKRIKPGGFVAVEDIDDGLFVEYPEPPQAWQHIVAAFRKHQSGRFGDRYVGRKLCQAGIDVGLKVLEMSVNPSASQGMTERDDLSVQFDIDRLKQALPSLIQAGALTEREWYDGLSEYRSSFPRRIFTSNATIRVLFEVP